jgi:hypothetical protein
MKAGKLAIWTWLSCRVTENTLMDEPWFDLNLEARAEILKKMLLVFWKKQCLHKIISVSPDLYKCQVNML